MQLILRGGCPWWRSAREARGIATRMIFARSWVGLESARSKSIFTPFIAPRTAARCLVFPRQRNATPPNTTPLLGTGCCKVCPCACAADFTARSGVGLTVSCVCFRVYIGARGLQCLVLVLEPAAYSVLCLYWSPRSLFISTLIANECDSASQQLVCKNKLTRGINSSERL